MYDLAGLITHLATDTGYSVDWSKMKEPSLANAGDAPTIGVGYHSVTPLGGLGEGDSPDPYEAFAEDLGQGIQLQIICKVEDFHIVWKAVYASMRGWIPLPAEQNYTGMFHSGGGNAGISNGRIFWIENWRIDFPRANPL